MVNDYFQHVKVIHVFTTSNKLGWVYTIWLIFLFDKFSQFLAIDY